MAVVNLFSRLEKKMRFNTTLTKEASFGTPGFTLGFRQQFLGGRNHCTGLRVNAQHVATVC